MTEELNEEYDYEAFSNREEKRKVQGYVSEAKSHLENVQKVSFKSLFRVTSLVIQIIRTI